MVGLTDCEKCLTANILTDIAIAIYHGMLERTLIRENNNCHIIILIFIKKHIIIKIIMVSFLQESDKRTMF